MALRKGILAIPAGALILFSLGANAFIRPPAAQETCTATSLAKAQEILRRNNRGIALMEQLKFGPASQEFLRITELDPLFAPGQVNLGIAYYNQQDYQRALQSLKHALALAPSQIQAHFILGLIYRNQDQVEPAIREFLQVIHQDPEDSSSHYYLGLLYSRRREYSRAMSHLSKVIRSEPYNASAHYNLAIALLRTEKNDEGHKAMGKFRRLQGRFGTTTVGLQYLEQGKYSLAVNDVAKYFPILEVSQGQESIRVVFREIGQMAGLTFRHGGPGSVDLTATSKEDLEGAIIPYLGSGVSFGDYDVDGRFDLFFANSSPEGLRGALFRNQGNGTFEEMTLNAGLTYAGKTTGALWGDYNNDSYPDLYLVNYGPNLLYRNNQDGTFSDVTGLAQVGDPSWGMGGAFVDYDHDGDLDLLVVNFLDLTRMPTASGAFPNDFHGADNVLYRNNGDGSFTDVSDRSGLKGGALKTVSAICTDFDNSRDIDFYFVNLDAPNQLFSNLRDGTFRDVALQVMATGEGRGVGIGAGDLNGDGLIDLVLPTLQLEETQILINQGRVKGYKILPAFTDLSSLGTVEAHSSQPLDFDNDGDLDILLVAAPWFQSKEQKAARNIYLLENRGDTFHDVSESVGLSGFQGLPLRGLSIADFDEDGDLDLVFSVNGTFPLLLRNDGGNQNNWLTIQLAGTSSNRSGIGTKVELKAGHLSQKSETYGGHGFLSQSPPLAHFGLGQHERVDMLRILWPGGVLQSEIDQPAQGKTIVKELNRKGTSCPLLYAWDGRKYVFQTDFLGNSAYGYLLSPGVYNFPDSDEYVKLDSSRLALREGKLAITLNNQLEEVILFDQLELVVVDHPVDYDVFPDEKLLPEPPYSPFSLITAANSRPPVAAQDGKGGNILPHISHIDRIYPRVAPIFPYKGYGKMQTIELDLGPISGERVFLLLYGWIDYANSTSNLAASQAGLKLIPPYLQVQDSKDRWVTMIENMGFPAGLPKFVTVDLSGRFLSESRKVRIISNMLIFWDQILVESGPPRKDYQVHRLGPDSADLHFRGFPEFFSPDRRRPKIYDYTRISLNSPWKTHIGGYTRYGDVLELLRKRDDMFAITRAGDEIEAFFGVSSLPKTPAGYIRDYIVYVDGFGKDMDINSARPDFVGPLPFHGMSSYPYPASEHYPDDATHLHYLKEWNTRTVDRWFPSLSSQHPIVKALSAEQVQTSRKSSAK